MILAVETSAKSGSAALVDENGIVGEFFINTTLTHSQTLMPMVDNLLKNTGTDINDVSAFAVSKGPGSFTGLRIGIAAIKGMAFALSKPCVAVSTLETVAQSLICENAVICAVMDARRNQFYNAIFSAQYGKINRLTDDRAIMYDKLLKELQEEYYDKHIVLAGDGTNLAFSLMNGNGVQLKKAQTQLMYQRASSVGILAIEKAKKGEFITSSELRAEYLRLPQAQRELNNRKGECL